MRAAIAAVVVLVIGTTLTACDESHAQLPTTTTTRTTAPVDRSIATFLNDFDASHLGGIPLDRTFTTDRMRITALSEGSYRDTVRSDATAADAGVTFDAFDDEALLYLGYVYCSRRDEGRPIDRSVASVVAIAALSAGHDPGSPSLGDYVTAVTTTNYASGSLCGDRYLDTREFLENLGS